MTIQETIKQLNILLSRERYLLGCSSDEQQRSQMIEALEVAKENAENLNANIEFYLSDVFENFVDKKIDLIVSNPPYIDKNTFVMDRVKNNEPHIALYAEENGLEIYRKII